MHRAILTPREQRSEPSGEPDRYAAARRGAAAAKQINDLNDKLKDPNIHNL